MKRSALLAGLSAAAGRPTKETPDSQTPKGRPTKPVADTVLIGGHFTREVRRTLLLVQAEEENSGKNLKQLLGEAINDLCAKYGKPQPYQGDE